jgi:hypothetical protein
MSPRASGVAPLPTPPPGLHGFATGRASFAIGWKGRYRIEGPAFIYSDEDTGRVATILGYPTDKLPRRVDREISNMFG